MVNLNRLKPAKIFANYPTDRGVIVDRICKLGDNRITLKGNEMTKSETLMSQLNQAESLIVRATQLVQKVVDADQVGDGVSAGAFFATAEELLGLIDSLGYEIVMPLQVEEDEREIEIADLEERLALLKSQR